MWVHKLTFTSERWGASQDRKPGSPGRSLQVTADFCYLDQSFVNDFCGPWTFLPSWALSSLKNTLKS